MDTEGSGTCTAKEPRSAYRWHDDLVPFPLAIRIRGTCTSPRHISMAGSASFRACCVVLAHHEVSMSIRLTSDHKAS